MILIDSIKKSRDTLKKLYPNAEFIDVTSKSDSNWVKLSPFFPHCNIPVPNSPGVVATCVEAIWQGLKVFKFADIDVSLFANDTMRNIKRTTRRFGIPIGHRYGVNSSKILSYIDARKKIYIPTYFWVLKNKVFPLIEELYHISQTKDIVLLDYDTNNDVENPSKPLSHASLIKRFIEENFDKKNKPLYKQLSLFEDAETK